MNNLNLLSFLVDKGVIDKDQRRIIETELNIKSVKIEECILKMRLTNLNTLTKLMTEFNNENLDINNFIVDTDLINKIPYTFCAENRCLPITLVDNCLYIAMNAPDMNVIETLNRFIHFHRTKIIKTNNTQLYELIQKNYAMCGNWIDFIEESDRSAEVFIDRLLLDAINKRASDIHFSCEELVVKVRYRIDGDLKKTCIFHKDHFSKISVRLKVLFSVDITNSVRSRDGSLTKFIYGERVDFRIGFHSCIYGENIVIRILHNPGQTNLDTIGYSPLVLENIRKMIKLHGGLIIFIGPTGSGKTTSLYAALQEIDAEKYNIMTVEDPVEYNLKGAQQVDINTHPNLTFASCLRSIMRQDPDVILIGEVRDAETAQMSLRAAMTGHKIFTTLHARNILDVLDRLEELGLSRRLCANNIRGIVAQRLVKKLCSHCAGRKCNYCDQLGYRDRCVIAESLFFDEQVIDIVLSSLTLAEKRSQLIKYGYQSMFDDGLSKIANGIISKEELIANLEGVI
jgi:type II secretory ATPase GspE/PulE/Tfp pilus assembly ATPase PilB-like protein